MKYFDLTAENVKWLPEDYLTMQLHNLNFVDGIGQVASTEIKYDCRVIEIDENGKISKAILQNEIEEGRYQQNTMPLKRVEDIITEINGKSVILETYSPVYKDENPAQRYLFTVIAGARDENKKGI